MTEHTVYTLHLWHRHGEEISVHASYEAAQSRRAGYCREWWQRELGPEPLPECDGLVIETYFALVDDEGGSIEPHQIEL